MTTYCSGSYVKRRLYISDADTTYNTILSGAIGEAEAYIDSVLRQYTSVPVSAPTLDLQYACADFAASIFRNDQLRKNTMQGTFGADAMIYDSYWTAGAQKMKDYIDAKYLKSGSTYKSFSVPDIKSLLDSKVISTFEARSLLGSITTGSMASHTSIDPSSILELNRQGIISIAEARALLNTITSGSTEVQARINLLKTQRDKLTGSDASYINAEVLDIFANINRLTGSGTTELYGKLNKLTGSDTLFVNAQTSNVYAEINRLTGSGTTELYGRLNKLTGSDILVQTAQTAQIYAEMQVLTGSRLSYSKITGSMMRITTGSDL